MTDDAASKMNSEWTIEDARGVYNIDRWGAEYFGINAAGRVVAQPLQEAGGMVELTEVVKTARKRKLNFPLLIRFV